MYIVFLMLYIDSIYAFGFHYMYVNYAKCIKTPCSGREHFKQKCTKTFFGLNDTTTR